ncbi:MAG TPA: glycoside hydrolase family 15 protein [Gammaproteobacteria bacterium]|nr:glycoside hydrolase family 15 protein [Gammaproteobacteria bacterium]
MIQSSTTGELNDLELGLIGNCQISLLVDRRGRYVWGCFPRPDLDPVFCSLLGPAREQAKTGFFEVDLVDFAKSEQRYLENTAILETTLYDKSGGSIRITDFAPRFRQYGRSFHPIMVIRNVMPVSGSPAIRIRLRPAAEYGAKRPETRQGSNHLRFTSSGFTLRLTTNASLTSILEERVILIEEPMSFVFGPDETLPQSPTKLCREMFGETKAYWESWVRALSIPFEWQDAVIRAAITLKLCTYEDTGAVLAALTTSIPEAVGSGRNWDYRYCWLRDSFYVVHALNRLGATETMEAFLSYLFNIVAELGSGERLQPVYGIGGAPTLEERVVDSLPGYRSMGPVRVGNDAYRQQQNDVYGAVILAATQLFFDRRLVRQGGLRDFARLESLGRRAVEVYDKPCAGPWEYRGRSAVFTYPSVMCWAACDRLARIARHLGLADKAGEWAAAAQTLRERIMKETWSRERHSFAASYGSSELDASLLTLADLGFLSSEDPRFLATVQAAEAELKEGPYLFRYSNPDDFGMPETAFGICTFWYIDALAAVGRDEEARELFVNMLERRTSLGLLSEDLCPRTGELWGNFPQTYSMVGIIKGAMRLSRSWEQAL